MARQGGLSLGESFHRSDGRCMVSREPSLPMGSRKGRCECTWKLTYIQLGAMVQGVSAALRRLGDLHISASRTAQRFGVVQAADRSASMGASACEGLVSTSAAATLREPVQKRLCGVCVRAQSPWASITRTLMGGWNIFPGSTGA